MTYARARHTVKAAKLRKTFRSEYKWNLFVRSKRDMIKGSDVRDINAYFGGEQSGPSYV